MDSVINDDSNGERFSSLHPLKTVLFDVDGTLCDSDPLHFEAFRDLLREIGFQGGVPIDEEFFIENIAGKHNNDIAKALFPDWDHDKAIKFCDEKEALFRRLAKEKLTPVAGIHKLCKWAEERGLRRAAVTNAPRVNGELMISLLGLTEFYEFIVVGGECKHAKPYPDPYLKALELLDVSKEGALVFEDSPSGIRAGVAAGLPVIALTTGNPAHLLSAAGASLLIKDYEDPKLWDVLDEHDKDKLTGGENK